MTAIRQDDKPSRTRPSTMRAVVLRQPGGPENLVLPVLPLPQPGPGWVRIAVRAFVTAYAGGADDLPPQVLPAYLDRLAAGKLAIGPLHTYALEDIPQAHADLEHNRVFGKLVGVIDPADRFVPER